MNGSPEPVDKRAIELARHLLHRAGQLQTPQERRQQAELDRMVAHEHDKATLVEMTDQAFRTSSSARVADQLTHLLDVQGVPRFFSPIEQTMLKGFQSFGEYLPGVAVPLVKEKMRRETANVILPAERDWLSQHLRSRQSQGVMMNVNLLGEALLGEAETSHRFERFVEALRMPELRCLSVKISTLYSQISPLAREFTVAILADRLESLYRTALEEKIPGTNAGKFVYLDMEEYRDLHLTTEVLKRTLERSGLERAGAGIALQAYIPDSYRVMQSLIEWSRLRVASHGAAPLTIRLVKGANMEMERVEASIAGFPQTPYKTKLETDANYKRMLRELLCAAGERVIRVGVASHNLFDIALAMIWTEDFNASDSVQFEMLEGMANHQRRAITERGEPMLLYAPACTREEFLHAIGYLIRRLDENTGPQNFLRHTYRLKADSVDFDKLSADFSQSLRMMDGVSDQPRRTQDRRQPPVQPPIAATWEAYVNEPDTDWSLAHNGEWIEQVLAKWKPMSGDAAPILALEIGGVVKPREASELRVSIDPSRDCVASCRYAAATVEEMAEAIDIARQDSSGWRSLSLDKRQEHLRRAAQQLRVRRGDLIASMVADAGKTIMEADPEVSEAIDFLEFYPLAMNWAASRRTVELQPRGVVAVITPWNFPLAIACGGVAAALAAGNTVILKPASETVLPAWLLCQCLWDAGVPRTALQLVPCDDEVAETLVRSPHVDGVVLTGATSTAKRMLEARPGLYLLAETGGKNATIVTSMADRDLAIKHVIQSAFGHSGQKCSATSLLLLDDEVFHDERFRETLADAVRSLNVGSAWNLESRIGPLIGPPGETLRRGMETLEDDESWLVAPQRVEGFSHLYKPCIKWNVRPGSFSHTTELFGPVLSVIRFSRLEEAIEIVRSTGYGLTSGLESLDDREIDLWQRTVRAGNLYVNRSTTGAIVLRQPFGGVGLSAYGPGVKAGGPHYVTALARVTDGVFEEGDIEAWDVGGLAQEDNARRLIEWLINYVENSFLSQESFMRVSQALTTQIEACRSEFDGEHDCVRVLGQDNFRRYRPCRALTLRVESGDDPGDILIAIAAAILVGTRLSVSYRTDTHSTCAHLVNALADEFPGSVEPLEESEAELIERIQHGHVGRLRFLSSIDARESNTSPLLLAACRDAFTSIVAEPVLRDGRLECLRCLDEQSLSHDYHRYGNLGRRASELRREVL